MVPKIKAAHRPKERALKRVDILHGGGIKASPGNSAYNDVLVSPRLGPRVETKPNGSN